MNMKTNNKLRLFGLMMALMAGGSLRGQEIGVLPNGFVGDSPITVLFTEGEYYSYVQLGSAEEERRTNDDVQYLWEIGEHSNLASIAFVSGPGGAVDESQFRKPRPWIRISSSDEHHRGKFELKCFRSYIGGHQRGETVIVYLTDCPEIVSITPKEGHGCWEDGDEITMDQFEVVTNPPTYADRVQLTDDSRIASAALGWNREQDLHFLLDGESSDYELPIYVSENGWQAGAGIHMDKKMLKAFDVIKSTTIFASKVKRVTDKIESFPFVKKTWGIKFDIDPYCEINLQHKSGCCNGDVVDFGNINCHSGVNATVGVHKLLPPTPFYFDGGFQGGFDLTLVDHTMSSVKNCEDNAFTFSFDLGFYGGLSVEVPEPPDIISASAKLHGGFTGKTIYNINTGKFTPFEPDGYFRIEVELIAIVRCFWSYNIID